MEYEHILIVDDSATSRMIIRRCFEIAGFSESAFYEAGDGLEALSFLEGHTVDLIITDLNMPKMDGTNLIKKLRVRPTTTYMPIIVISSTINSLKEEELQKLRIQGLISKPISPEKIAALFRDRVERDDSF